jgi:hypothetical protein
MIVRDLSREPQGMESPLRRGVYLPLSAETDPFIIRRDWRDLVDAGVLEDHKREDLRMDAGTVSASSQDHIPYSRDGDLKSHLSASITDFGLLFAAFIDADRNG